jgi:ribosomal protein S21
MGLKMRLWDREPIGLALRRFRKLLQINGLLAKSRPRHFVNASQLRRTKRYWKSVMARHETYRAKRAGLR